MVDLDEYYLVWRGRLSGLKKSLKQIKLLSKDAQFMQAILVRNACLDFLTELESAFEIILRDAIRRQEELFLAAVDDLHLSVFNKKPLPIDFDSPAHLDEQKECLRNDVRKWAVQSVDFETSVLLVQAGYNAQVHIIIDELTITYGVAPRDRKKK